MLPAAPGSAGCGYVCGSRCAPGVWSGMGAHRSMLPFGLGDVHEGFAEWLILWP